MPVTMTASDNDDIQTFHFTHLEMAIISVALSTFQAALIESHLESHIMAGACNKGEATVITMVSNIQGTLGDRMNAERMTALMGYSCYIWTWQRLSRLLPHRS